MMTHVFPSAIVVLSTAFFIAIWCASSLFLGWLTGWFDLQQWYGDDGNEDAYLKLRWVSASMGSFGVYLKHCIILGAKPSGLSIAMFRIFAPFEKPLLVPWHDIEVEQASSFGFAKVRLRFGNPSVGELRINQWTWARLVDVLPSSIDTKALKTPGPSTSNDGAIATNLFVQWILMTSAISAAFYGLSTINSGPHLPLLFVIFLFAVCGAIGQVVRYVRLT